MSNNQKEQVFTIRIKLLENAKAKWQGYIIAPPDDNKKRYFSDLFKLDLYIIPHLKKMGIQVSWFWQIMSWYKSKKNYLSRCMKKRISDK
jgi:hypothetical protein